MAHGQFSSFRTQPYTERMAGPWRTRSLLISRARSSFVAISPLTSKMKTRRLFVSDVTPLRRSPSNSVLVLKPSLSSAYIEIPSATTYSIGDRPATIWVAGETGWFEIRPSEAYKPIHDEALEATTFYFTALETYEEYNKSIRGRGKSNRQPPPSLDDVLLKYAVRMGNGILRDEAEALCRKWAEFLICHFNREKGLNWNPTPFAKQLREWYPVRSRCHHGYGFVTNFLGCPQARTRHIERDHSAASSCTSCRAASHLRATRPE